MIRINVLRNGHPVEPDDENDSPYYSPEKALANLVGRLTGDAGITSIGPNGLTIDCPSMNERVEFEGNEDDMDLLHDVCFLYIQARPWLCSESVRMLVK